MLQEVCVLKKDWDDVLEGDIKSHWFTWLAELKKAREIVFSRCFYQSVDEDVLQCWIHGFGDASKNAYCAMVYLVYCQTSGTYSSLIAAKTRVAPVKRLTIPQLELMSPRILATLSTTVKNALKNKGRSKM